MAIKTIEEIEWEIALWRLTLTPEQLKQVHWGNPMGHPYPSLLT